MFFSNSHALQSSDVFASEVKLQGKLNLPGSARRQRESEATLWICRIKFQRRGFGADCAKLPKQIVHVVEHIEEFRTEFEVFLLVDRELFDERGVPGDVSRPFNVVARSVSKCSQNCIVYKRASIE